MEERVKQLLTDQQTVSDATGSLLSIMYSGQNFNFVCAGVPGGA